MKILNNHVFNQFNILAYLIWRDLIELKDDMKNNLIDALLWPLKSIILYSFFMPAFGLQLISGDFILVGTIVIISFLNIFDSVNKLLNDINQVGYLDYELILPISSYFIFIKRIILFTIKSILIIIPVYIIGIILLQNQFSGIPLFIFKTILITIVLNFTFASLALLITSLTSVRNLYHSPFATILFTASDFGCYLYSWQILYFQAPLFAYIVLINPLVYGMEGIRSAVIGQANYINYWVCLSMLIIFFVIFALFAMKKLKKKLDCL